MIAGGTAAIGATTSEPFVLDGLGRRLPTLIAATRHGDATHPALRRVHDSLLAPLRHLEEDIRQTVDVVTVGTAEAGSSDALAASAVLRWGYCSHYYTGCGEPTLPAEEFDATTRAHTLVATIGLGAVSSVIGTLQVIVGPTVPALSLFAPTPGVRLPHWGQPGPVGELRRFGVSPVLEATGAGEALDADLRLYRSRVYRALYSYAHRILRASGVSAAYGVATPEIFRFFTRSGMPMIATSETALVDSGEVRALLTDFARYWRPDAPPQQRPQLYEIPTERRTT